LLKARNSGFKIILVEMAQFLIDVGTKHGAAGAKELLLHPATLS
jgi:hypothetical protein